MKIVGERETRYEKIPPLSKEYFMGLSKEELVEKALELQSELGHWYFKLLEEIEIHEK